MNEESPQELRVLEHVNEGRSDQTLKHSPRGVSLASGGLKPSRSATPALVDRGRSQFKGMRSIGQRLLSFGEFQTSKLLKLLKSR